MKTGTKHQNKNNRGKEGGKQKKKRKAVNTKRTKEEKTCWKEGKACISMPQPIEQYKPRPSLESRLLKKYKSLKKYNLLKLKCPQNHQYVCYRDIHFINCLISFDSVIHTSAFPSQQCCMCCSSRHTSLVHT